MGASRPAVGLDPFACGMLRGSAAPERATCRRPGGRGVRGRRSRRGSGLWSGLGLRLRFSRSALSRRHALLFLTGRRSFFHRPALFRLRLRLLRLLCHHRLPIVCGFATVTLPARRPLPPRWIPASRRAPRVWGLRSPSRSARRCGRPGSLCPQRSASCSRGCRQRSRRA